MENEEKVRKMMKNQGKVMENDEKVRKITKNQRKILENEEKVRNNEGKPMKNQGTVMENKEKVRKPCPRQKKKIKKSKTKKTKKIRTLKLFYGVVLQNITGFHLFPSKLWWEFTAIVGRFITHAVRIPFGNLQVSKIAMEMVCLHL